MHNMLYNVTIKLYPISGVQRKKDKKRATEDGFVNLKGWIA